MDKAELAATVAHEIQAARGALAAAMNNLAGPYGTEYRSCIKEMYFACFHMATALLASKGLRAKSHDAIHQLLALHFVKPAVMLADTAKKYNALMERRHVADYKTFIPVDASDIAELKPWVSSFIGQCLDVLHKSMPKLDTAPMKDILARFDELAIAPG